MFAAERHRKIKDLLLEKKQIDVNSLSTNLGVSEVTIRRDLEKLELENFLIRTHGGAILNEEEHTFLNTSPLIEKEDQYAEHKTLIGKFAYLMLNDCHSAILGPGSTCKFIAKHIKSKKNLLVITSDIYIALELLSEPSNVKTVITGGEVDKENFLVSGNIAEISLNNIYADIAFVEINGIILNKGYFVDNIAKVSIIQKILTSAKEVVAVCDYSKFSNASLYYLGTMDMFKKVISNELVPEEFKHYYFNNNIKLLCTYDIYEEST
jgi:DeoR family fructose operon transcriptional repressor